jgi:hypothetical protein
MTDTTNLTPQLPIAKTAGHRMRYVERAAGVYEAAQQKLYRPDGAPIYADAEHAARDAAHLAEFDRIARREYEEAEADAAAAVAQLAQLDGTDPLDTLSDAEVQRAAARLPFVSEDADRPPLAAFVTRIESVLLAGDTPQVYAYWKTSVRRLETERETGRAGTAGVLAQVDALGRCTAALADPKMAAKRASAEALRTEAQRALRDINHRRAQLTGAYLAQENKMRQQLGMPPKAPTPAGRLLAMPAATASTVATCPH